MHAEETHRARLEAANSFVPRLVRARLHSGRSSFEAAVLFVDVVGFTARASALVDAGPDGFERISALLDGHYSKLLSVIDKHGGEAVRFVGDALLVVFADGERSLGAATHAALACANEIATTSTSNDGLAVRAAVTAGPVEFLSSGDVTRHFVIAGTPLEELSGCIAKSKPGAVVTSDAVSRLLASPIADIGPLRPQTLDAPFAEMRAYVPASVLTRIETGTLEWLAELRTVSAVFVCAPSGGEAIVDVVREQSERHSAYLKEIVVDDKGWTFVAATGVPPFAEPDDASRAVRLARAIAKELEKRSISVGIGVATGRAFCGAVGAPSRREYAIVGSVMNLASRLAGASKGRAICDEPTARAIRKVVATTELPALTFKGFKRPIPIFEIGEDLAHGRGAITGRTHERAEIAAILEAKTGASIFEGEPGIGKSHLLDEAAKQARAHGISVLSGAGNSASRAAAYHPWRAVFEALITQRGSVDALLGAHSAFAPLLSAVISAAPVDNDVTRELAGQVRAERTRQLLVDVLCDAAAQRPILLVLEDLHAVDAPSLELLEALLNRKAPGITFLASTRPGAEIAALTAAGARVWQLAPLARDATEALLKERLGVGEIGPVLVEQVHARAAGNPLFVEQLALSLAESKVIRIEGGRCLLAAGASLSALELPPTVQGAITARLDRLAPPEQLTLKTASVVGPTFTDRLVTEVYPHADDRSAVGRHFDTLTASQLIDPEEPESHRFRHDMVRDVAYEMMLFAQRRALHRDIAAWYERSQDDLTPYLAILAHHHRNAGDSGRAVDYLEREAIRAFSIGLARQSVAVGVEAAGLLGVDLPRDPESAGPHIRALVGATMAALAGRQPNELLSLPPLTKPEVGRTIKLLLELAPFTFQAGRPELYAVMALTCLALTLEHGASAPDVYSTYSVVHRSIHRDAAGAYQWSQLALDYDAKTGSSARSRVAFVHSWFHNHWVRPFSTSIADSLEAAEQGLASGDILFGCYNLSAHVVYLAAAGAPLEEVIERGRAHHSRNGRRVVNAAFHCLHEMQIAKALAGKTRAPLSLTDDEVDEERDLGSICVTDYYNQIGYYLVSRVKLHQTFGDPRGALEWAGRIGPLVQAISGQVAEIDLVLHRTLAEIDVGELEPARAAVAEVATWAKGCPQNFAAMYELLDGALAHAEGDEGRAKFAFARAIAASSANQQIHLRALAEERAARMPGNEAMRAASIASYRAWGAHAKADALARM